MMKKPLEKKFKTLSNNYSVLMVEVMASKYGKCSASESRSPVRNIKAISAQKVDPHFTELLSKFKSITTNTESLFHACEQYKRALRCFFMESIEMLEKFRHALDERDTLSSSPINSPHLNSGFIENAAQDAQPSQLPLGPEKISVDCSHSPSNISRLQRQMIVIVRRTEQDLLFFEKSVQNPLLHLMAISRKIARTISRRSTANAEWGCLATKHHHFIRNAALGKKDFRQKQEETSLHKKLQTSFEKFEAINELCKDGLSRYLNLSHQLIDTWFHNYYYTNLRISYALHRFSWNVPEFRRIGMGSSCDSCITNVDQLITVVLSTASILEDFHTSYDGISNQVTILIDGLDK